MLSLPIAGPTPPSPTATAESAQAPHSASGPTGTGCGIRPAMSSDLDALVRLEEAAFASDRISRRQFRYMLARAQAALLVAEQGNGDMDASPTARDLLGYVLVLFNRATSVARLYSIDVEVDIAYPIVLKIPEGSFSRGVFKVENRAELERISRRLFKESDLILAQEYLYTAFDWRIGILGRQPLYACKYLMSRDHWQIVRHESDGSRTEGGFETVRVEDVPKPVLRVALRAANLIGNGLYGVDVKATERGAVCIEVNDNPNIDAGVEDRILGDALYRAIVGHLIERLEQGRTASARGAAHRD
jgi:hypothetical protein